MYYFYFHYILQLKVKYIELRSDLGCIVLACFAAYTLRVLLFYLLCPHFTVRVKLKHLEMLVSCKAIYR